MGIERLLDKPSLRDTINTKERTELVLVLVQPFLPAHPVESPRIYHIQNPEGPTTHTSRPILHHPQDVHA